MSGKREPEDFTELLRKWTQRLMKPYAQGLIRKLTRSQVEGLVPDGVLKHLTVEAQPDGTLLVIIQDHPAAASTLQAICDADWEEVQIERQLEADREVSAGHRDDDPADSL